MANYSNLEELLLAVIEEQVALGLATILKNQDTAAAATAKLADQISGLQVFVGMTDPPSLSAADLAALAGVEKASLDLEHAVEAISTEAPAQQKE